MDQYANCSTIALKVCNLINHESQRSISHNELQSSNFQHNAKQELILL